MARAITFTKDGDIFRLFRKPRGVESTLKGDSYLCVPPGQVLLLLSELSSSTIGSVFFFFVIHDGSPCSLSLSSKQETFIHILSYLDRDGSNKHRQHSLLVSPLVPLLLSKTNADRRWILPLIPNAPSSSLPPIDLGEWARLVCSGEASLFPSVPDPMSTCTYRNSEVGDGKMNSIHT